MLCSFFRGETNKRTVERHPRSGGGVFACTANHQHPRYLAATAELLSSRRTDCGNLLLEDIQRLRSQGEPSSFKGQNAREGKLKNFPYTHTIRLKERFLSANLAIAITRYACLPDEPTIKFPQFICSLR